MKTICNRTAFFDIKSNKFLLGLDLVPVKQCGSHYSNSNWRIKDISAVVIHLEVICMHIAKLQTHAVSTDACLRGSVDSKGQFWLHLAFPLLKIRFPALLVFFVSLQFYPFHYFFMAIIVPAFQYIYIFDIYTWNMFLHSFFLSSFLLWEKAGVIIDFLTHSWISKTLIMCWPAH